MISPALNTLHNHEALTPSASPPLHPAAVNELMMGTGLMSRASVRRQGSGSELLELSETFNYPLITLQLPVSGSLAAQRPVHELSPIPWWHWWIWGWFGWEKCWDASQEQFQSLPHSAHLPSPLMLLRFGFNYNFPSRLSINFVAGGQEIFVGPCKKKNKINFS